MTQPTLDELIAWAEILQRSATWNDEGLRNITGILESLRELRGSQWVSVKDRTPDDQYDVLVTDGKFVGLGDCCKGHLWNSYQVEGAITHWKHLPTPPQGSK